MQILVQDRGETVVGEVAVELSAIADQCTALGTGVAKMSVSWSAKCVRWGAGFVQAAAYIGESRIRVRFIFRLRETLRALLSSISSQKRWG